LLLAFSLGAALVLADMAPASAVAVVAALFLSMKRRLHQWIERLELEALLKLALISVVILPLLPDQGYGPGSTLTPSKSGGQSLWWRVCLSSDMPQSGWEVRS